MMSVSLRWPVASHAVTRSPSWPRSANIVAEKIFTPLNGATLHRSTRPMRRVRFRVAGRIRWRSGGAADSVQPVLGGNLLRGADSQGQVAEQAVAERVDPA